MTRIRLAAVLAAALVLLTACGAQNGTASGTPQETPETRETMTVTDDLGREVTVPVRPARVAALIGSFADVWALADGVDSLAAAADDTWTSFDLPLGENVVNLGGVKSVSLESLLSADPDLVIGSCNTAADLELLPTLEELGIPAVYFQVDSFGEYLHMLDVCTTISDRPENYERYGEAVRAQVDAAAALRDGSAPTVLYIRATGSSVKAKGSTGTVLGEMLSDLGCRNIADGSSLLEDLSLEAILAAEPDYVFLIYQGSDPTDAKALLDETLLSNPAWATLLAVEEGRCYVMDNRLYNLKPNAQWGTAYEQLARILYGGADGTAGPSGS